MTEAINKSTEKCEALELAQADQRALVRLLKDVFEVLEVGLEWKHIESAKTRARIIGAVSRAMQHSSRNSCLEAIGISLSRYKRWRRDSRGCGIPNTRSCPKGNINQLTSQELKTMKNLVTSLEFAHFPIRSLHFHAKRESLLFCSYSTWRKYITEFNWKRPRKLTRERKYRVGIRAKLPNEIWHLDLSYFTLPNKKKCFIQAIVDNYSRYVVAWQVLESFDGSLTGNLVKMALEKTIYLEEKKNPKLRLLVDGGGENKGESVNSLEQQGDFRKEVAQFEIIYSNSIVEAVFRSLKHNYLFHKDVTTFSALARHVDIWFKDHNEKIPHTAFNGETPLERFNRSWNKENEVRIIISHQAATKLRIKENQKVSCSQCEVD
jgi:putative transposase